MRIRIVPWEPALLEPVSRFVQATWRRPLGSFARWRYLECPSLSGALAMRGDECVATLFAFHRRHRWGRSELDVLETHDWAVLPSLQGSGLGIRVIRALMADERPLVAYGGSADTQSIVPRLGWVQVGQVAQLSLPLGGSVVAGPVRAKTGLPGEPAGALARFVTSAALRLLPRRRPKGGRVIAASGLGPEVRPLHEARETGWGPVADPAHARWITGGHPANGAYLTSYFTVGGRLRGYTIGRAIDAEAQLVAMVTPDDALLPWMVTETVLRLLPYRPDRVVARAGSPAEREALAACGFLHRGDLPVNVWSKRGLPEGPVHVGRAGADQPLLPYREQWFEEDRST